MGFLDKMKTAAKSASEKATSALKESGILVTGFKPMPPEIKNLPQGGSIRGGNALSELMKTFKPDANGKTKTLGICIHDGMLYIVERERIWMEYKITDIKNIVIEDVQKSENDRLVRYIYLIKMEVENESEPLFYEENFAIPKTPIDTYMNLTKAAIARLHIFFNTFEMDIHATAVVTSNNTPERLNEFSDLKAKIEQNGYVWSKM